MNPMIVDGWVAVPYDGNDFSDIHLAVGDPEAWFPAYRDWVDGQRVVQIRPPVRTGPTIVWIKVDGRVTQLSPVTL
jgi:hypothetical protein